jgi:hypothetical protein
MVTHCRPGGLASYGGPGFPAGPAADEAARADALAYGGPGLAGRSAGRSARSAVRRLFQELQDIGRPESLGAGGAHKSVRRLFQELQDIGQLAANLG